VVVRGELVAQHRILGLERRRIDVAQDRFECLDTIDKAIGQDRVPNRPLVKL